MSHRRRLHYLTFGGWLVVAILLAVPVLAQQDGPKPDTVVNEAQGVAGETPTPNDNSGKSANGEQTPTAEPPPQAVPVQDKASTERPCDARCQAAEKREDADLVAQQRMAESTEDVVGISKGQLAVGGIGITLLVVTVFLSIKATNAALRAAKAAEDAVQITADTAKRQLRAYIDITTARVEWTGNNAIIRIITKNAGQTPAHKVTHWTKGSVGVENEFIPLNDADRANLQKWTQGPGIDGNHTWSFPPFLPGNDPRTDSIRIPLNVWGEIKYEDVFGNERFTKYRLIMAINPADPTQFILAPCKDGNKST